MSGNAGRNQGVRLIHSFEDRAIPLNTPPGVDRPAKASRSANDGIALLADFASDVQPLNRPETAPLDTLNGLFAQHEQKVQRLVNKLQGRIEELQKQIAELTGLLLDKDRIINRYYLDGPSEDEI
jgi:hypothetical protein